MFSFFQTIFHKVTTVIATAAIAIGFISAPELPKQPVSDNPSPVVVEQQLAVPEIQKEKPKPAQSETNSSIDKLKTEIESLRKSVTNQNKPKSDTPKTEEAPVVQTQPSAQPPAQQHTKTVPPRPDNSNGWTFNWDTWVWEKQAPSPVPVIQQTAPQPIIYQYIIQQPTPAPESEPIVPALLPAYTENELWVFIVNITTYGSGQSNSFLDNSSQALISVGTIPQGNNNSNSEIWADASFYLNDQLITNKNNKLSSMSFNPGGLTPDSVYTYKIIFKIDRQLSLSHNNSGRGREDTVRTGQFRTPKSEPGKTYQIQSSNSNGTYYCSNITSGWQIPVIIKSMFADSVKDLTETCP